MSEFSQRKRLPHTPPDWLELEGEVFFITICCQPRGRNHIANDNAWHHILDTFLHYETLNYWFPRFVLAMPDHLHALVSLPTEGYLRKRIQSFKSWTTKQASIPWQRDFFDHRLRGAESLVAKAEYIGLNPVRAGLCTLADDWPYRWNRLKDR